MLFLLTAREIVCIVIALTHCFSNIQPKVAQYTKPRRVYVQAIKKKQFVHVFLSLSDYMYAVAANLQTIDYIPERLMVEDLEDGDELTCLDNAVIDTSIEEANTTAEARALLTLLLAELEPGV